jgi:hypothetical protein
MIDGEDGPQSGQVVHGDGLTKGAASLVKSVGGLTKLRDMFGTDPVLESEGAWMTVAPTVRLRVRSAQSEAARTISAEITQPFRALWAAGGTLSSETNDDVELTLCAKAYVTDWEGITNDDGAPLACTDLNVMAVLRELPHLRRAVAGFATTISNFQKPR